MTEDPRIAALPDIHGHAKGEHKPFAEERPIPYTARMLFLWFFHACRRGSPRFLMVADHMNYLTFEDPAAVNLVRRALKLAQAGDLYGAAETAGVEIGHAQVVGEGLRKGMRYSIGAEIDNDPRCRPDAQNIVDAMKPDGTVRSVHFIAITHPQHGENWMWAFDNHEFKDLYDVIGTDAVWEIYMTTLLDAIDKLPGNIVGHFYVPAKFGHWPADDVLENYEDRFVDACAERGMAIEVNSRYLYKYFVDDAANLEKFRAVHLRLLRKAKDKGVAIAVGSDAHSPKDQGGAFEAVLALLDEADINEIAFPIAGRLARVALRATEEILRQHTAALVPSVSTIAEITVDPADETGDDETPVAEPVSVAAPPKRKRPAAKSAVAEAAPDAVADPAAELEAVPAAAATPKKARPKKPPVALEESAAEHASPVAVVVEAVVESIVEAVTTTIPAAAKAVAERVTGKKTPKPAAAVEVVSEPVVESVPQPAPVARPEPKKNVEPNAAAPKPTPIKVASSKASSTKAVAAKAVATKPVATKSTTAKASTAKSAPAKPASKPAPKKAAAKKPVPKKAAPAKKTPAVKKPQPKKAAAKKAIASKPAGKKAALKKAAPKKIAAKKPIAKKAAPKRAAPARKPVAKKAAKKTAKRRR